VAGGGLDHRDAVDRWWFLDNSGPEGPRLVASGGKDNADEVNVDTTWTKLLEEFR